MAESFLTARKDFAINSEGAARESTLKLRIVQGVQACNGDMPILAEEQRCQQHNYISPNGNEGKHRQMSADPVYTDRWGNLFGRIINEITKFLGMAAYLWVILGLMALHASIVLAEHQISYKFYGFAIVNSLLLAKVMLIAEDLHLGEKFKDRPLVYPILYKAFLYATLFICFDFVEEVLVGLVRGKTFAQSIPELGGSPRGVFFVAIILSLGLIPFFAFREIGRVIGERELRALLFTSGRGVGPRESRVQRPKES